MEEKKDKTENKEKNYFDYNNAFNKISDAVNSYYHYQEIREGHITERIRIKENGETIRKNLDNQKELFKDYFNKEYSLKKEAIDKYFILLDKCMAENNLEALQGILMNLGDLMKNNPITPILNIQQQAKKLLESDSIDF
ncbi:MAG: hypothetical protein J1F16_05480 [Muribaculaceae bacterium]|nr:hypothetical protein [Muribaculaceae bacterium]